MDVAAELEPGEMAERLLDSELTEWRGEQGHTHRAHEGVSGHHDCSPGQEDALDHVEGART